MFHSLSALPAQSNAAGRDSLGAKSAYRNLIALHYSDDDARRVARLIELRVLRLFKGRLKWAIPASPRGIFTRHFPDVYTFLISDDLNGEVGPSQRLRATRALTAGCEFGNLTSVHSQSVPLHQK
jgi:hypothetical protein